MHFHKSSETRTEAPAICAAAAPPSFLRFRMKSRSFGFAFFTLWRATYSRLAVDIEQIFVSHQSADLEIQPAITALRSEYDLVDESPFRSSFRMIDNSSDRSVSTYPKAWTRQSVRGSSDCEIKTMSPRLYETSWDMLVRKTVSRMYSSWGPTGMNCW